jgi:hypothetical protein
MRLSLIAPEPPPQHPEPEPIDTLEAVQLWAMYGRRPRCKRNLMFCEAFGCSHVYGLFFARRLAFIAMRPLWPLALM